MGSRDAYFQVYENVGGEVSFAPIAAFTYSGGGPVLNFDASGSVEIPSGKLRDAHFQAYENVT